MQNPRSFLMTKIPVTVISGFLGAGKTTIIQKLLESAKGKRLALIINEFGDRGVDSSLLQGCGFVNCAGEDVIELNNGCICCTVADDFIPAVSKLLTREKKPDHIIIETSGLALPQPLIAAFNWPVISTQVTVDGVVTVVDAPAVVKGSFANDPEKVNIQRRQDDTLNHENSLEELFEDQIHAADLILLNKTDLLDNDSLLLARTRVMNRNMRCVPILLTHCAMLGSDVLLGLGVGSEKDIENRKSNHTLYHEKAESHDHDDFRSFVIQAGEIREPKDFVNSLKVIIFNHAILRLKGFASVANKPMRLVLQAVGQRIEYYFDRPWREEEKRETCLVAIGMRAMNKNSVIRAVLKLV